MVPLALIFIFFRCSFGVRYNILSVLVQSDNTNATIFVTKTACESKKIEKKNRRKIRPFIQICTIDYFNPV